MSKVIFAYLIKNKSPELATAHNPKMTFLLSFILKTFCCKYLNDKTIKFPFQIYLFALSYLGLFCFILFYFYYFLRCLFVI